MLSAGLGGMGGAQPLAVTMNGGVGLFVEIDRERIERRLRLGYVDRATGSLDEALGWAEEARRERRPLSIALHGNAADAHEAIAARQVRPDVVTDQTSAHDMLNGYVPAGLDPAEAAELRRRDPAEYARRAYASLARHMRAMLELQRQGAVLFDYGNNIRREAENAGVGDFSYPGFVPAFIRPLFCEGSGPFRWVALSGDPEDIFETDRALTEAFARRRAPRALAADGAGARALPGAARAHLLARLRRAGPRRADLQRPRRLGPRQGADRHRPRPSRLRLGGLAEPRDGVDARRLRRHRRLAGAERALNTAAGATWVSVHHGGGVGIGYSIHAGMVVVADGTADAARRLERVLTTDPGTGIMRHADAGYPEAVEAARRHGVKLPGIAG